MRSSLPRSPKQPDEHRPVNVPERSSLAKGAVKSPPQLHRRAGLSRTAVCWISVERWRPSVFGGSYHLSSSNSTVATVSNARRGVGPRAGYGDPRLAPKCIAAGWQLSPRRPDRPSRCLSADTLPGAPYLGDRVGRSDVDAHFKGRRTDRCGRRSRSDRSRDSTSSRNSLDKIPMMREKLIDVHGCVR